jgi:hypothetical protein
MVRPSWSWFVEPLLGDDTFDRAPGFPLFPALLFNLSVLLTVIQRALKIQSQKKIVDFIAE